MPSLTRAEATDRAALIRVETYRVDLDLTLAGGIFGSRAQINFGCTGPGASTFVEVRPRLLRSVTLNGVEVPPEAYADGRLTLAGLAERNVLVVEAEMAYTNTGQGLRRFVDPVDDRVYVYASLFLDEAPTVFACFDQPDLKAPFTIGVRVDPQWMVAGNGAETCVAPGRWELATTEPLATYFVTLIAGPYHCLRTEHDGIPLAVYARAALAPHLDHQSAEIFTITRNCLDRYHELFGVRYPFGKYDQAFVPEFTMGAMENPGCVTFRDEYVFTSAVTEAEREQRAIVIAHEMAHMWFGDLVTMRWWDDLWLNESFAEYLGHRVTAEVTTYRQAWTTFAVGRKAWGYAADQRPSTHPVSGAVGDAEQALLNFDGISYAKGASILRQLVALLGDEAFFGGLREHFAAHAYGNATLADLLDALCRSSGRDLEAWAEVWLRTAQVSTLWPELTIDADGRYATVDVAQSVPESHPILRPHRLRVATYGADGQRRDVVELDIDPDREGTRTPVVDLIGRPAADLVLVNDGDLTYAKVRLDDASRARLPAILPFIDDSLTRALLWGAVWGSTRDADCDAMAFVDLCVVGLPVENEVAIFDDVLGYARDFAVARYLPVESRAAARSRLAAACRSALDEARPGSGRQLAAARGMISCAGLDDEGWMRSWLTDLAAAPAGLRVDAEMRWLLISALAASGAASADDIDNEYARDHTASGAEHAARARAARPDEDAKAWAWSMLIHDETLSNRLLFGIASGFWRPGQDAITESYVDRFVADMPAMAVRRDSQAAEQIGLLAYPSYAVDTDTLAKMIRMRDDGSLVPALRRSLIDETDELARSVAARRLARRVSEAPPASSGPSGTGEDVASGRARRGGRSSTTPTVTDCSPAGLVPHRAKKA